MYRYESILVKAKWNRKDNIFIIFSEKGIRIRKISEQEDSIRNIQIRFKSYGNAIIIHEKTRFINAKILLGERNIVFIEESKDVLQNLTIDAKNSGGTTLSIDKNFLCSGCYFKLKEGKKITIGKDCMFSFDIAIWNSDCHAIFKDGECINKGEDVIIGNRVWIGHGVEILKGTLISDDSVVAARALVNKKFLTPNCIIAGIPGKVINQDISWDRRSPAKF